MRWWITVAAGCDGRRVPTVLPPSVPSQRSLPCRAVTAALAALAAAVLLVAPLPAEAAPSPATAAAARETGWQWPLASAPAVLRAFAAPEHRWSPGHRGVDLAAPAGTGVLAPADGVVVFAGAVAGRPVLSIATGGAVRVTLEPVVASVAVGERVARGSAVGVVADGGEHCGGVGCLHWGVRVGRDHYLDPLLVLARGARAAPPVLLPLAGRRA